MNAVKDNVKQHFSQGFNPKIGAQKTAFQKYLPFILGGIMLLSFKTCFSSPERPVDKRTQSDMYQENYRQQERQSRSEPSVFDM